MIVNAYVESNRVATYEGTRLLQSDLGIIGQEIYDPKEPLRRWFVASVYAPLPGRALGGIRAKLQDEKGFVSFINQRDLEVSLGLVSPGQWCTWAGQKYVDPEDREWFGICADEEDLLDDLHEREMTLRAYYAGGILYPPLEIVRRIHVDVKSDFQETFTLLWDMDMETQMGPDLRLETIEGRWSKTEKERVVWDRL